MEESNLNILDMLEQAAGETWHSGGLWLVLALPLAMAAMNIVKPVIRQLIPNPAIRRLTLFLVAFVIGYLLGILLIDSAEAWKWAVFVGLINPVLYQYLLNRAIASGNMARIASLKGRELVRKEDGELSHEETQQLISKRKIRD